TGERSCRCESSHVQFIHNQILEVEPLPTAITPGKVSRIDDLGWTVHSLRLEAGGGIRKRPLTVRTVSIMVARLGAGNRTGEVTVRGLRQGMYGLRSARSFQNHVQCACRRRPDAKPDPLFIRPGAKRGSPRH